ncbi:GNAT family N-acetyltransferase [Agreia pratensis]|uniref:GNAT family N-acetyltransferase n=1 Tax=Agreia pratensis TaxID=150121 RepID=UPI00188D6B27|nr:GNAT family protein [Agreia pratensis]MBF4633558.1 GNAT family N-acetyltransferase [Agreia pratensis]
MTFRIDSSFLPVDLGGGASLVLRDLDTVDEMLALTERNLGRLRKWEHWAHAEQTREALAAYTTWLVSQYSLGYAVPAAIRLDDQLVGVVTARTDSYSLVTELGFWIDGAFEGRGLVGRASAALVHRLQNAGAPRIEIKTSVQNDRSRRVAERLGFVHEGTLRSALQVGDTRHDLAVYGWVPLTDQ